MRTQGYAGNSLRNCEADLGDEHKFGKCSVCGTFHSCNSSVSRNTKRSKCGKIGHIQAVCNTITSPNRSLWILLFLACECIHWGYTRKFRTTPYIPGIRRHLNQYPTAQDLTPSRRQYDK
ncbi:unnamed protein product [Schistosoma mattheei]|uniref:Uncharacterized protein n=1 Tax=Schistosoma mattheei TaxID=31246 RepID=A0A183NV27_9TREM|nr:unnamed protein product [Schistosoma mattheei]